MKKMSLLALALAVTLSAGSTFAEDTVQKAEKKTVEVQNDADKAMKQKEKKTINVEKSFDNFKKDVKEGAKSTGEAADRAFDKASDKARFNRGYKLGERVDDFTLKLAQTGEMKSLKDVAGKKATVVIFWNQDCPWCEGQNGAAKAIEQMTAEYADQGVNVVLIDPGSNDKPEEKIISYAKDKATPLLINNDSSVAARFDARYTPHTFILDADHRVVYKGAFQTKRGDKVRSHAQDALEDLLAGEPVAAPEVLGRGCTIKWAPGAEPKA